MALGIVCQNKMFLKLTTLGFQEKSRLLSSRLGEARGNIVCAQILPDPFCEAGNDFLIHEECSVASTH